MFRFKSAVLVAMAAFGVMTTAHGGTEGAFTFYTATPTTPPVVALSNPVTYSRLADAAAKLAALQTHVGFNVGSGGFLFKNTSGNTINRVTITFTASVTDVAEALTFYNPNFYLASLPCTWDNEPANKKTITCEFQQIRNGEGFPSFTVFYVAPVQSASPVASDKVKLDILVTYAEGTSGGNPTQNSRLFIPMGETDAVALGTQNPVNVKSAVPKSTDKLLYFTGNGGVPTNVTGKRATELMFVPTVPTDYAIADISIATAVVDPVPVTPTTDQSNCLTAGNFKECSTYATSIVGPTGDETLFSDSNPLKTVYRFDASNLKRSQAKILNSVQIYYSGVGVDGVTIFNEVLVQACSSAAPTPNGVPCVIDKFCYKRGTLGWTPALEGACEFQLINKKNGLAKFL